MKNKVTIQDIADELGISRNTVSKAINNSDGLAEATRTRILQKAVEMGYKQFSYVQDVYNSTVGAIQTPLRPMERREIALLTSLYFGSSHFASTMLDRLQRELSQLGYRLNTYHVTEENTATRQLPFSFQPERVSGVVCVEMFDWAYDLMLCDLGLPILFIDGPAQTGGRSLPADQLYMDSYAETSRFVYDMMARGVTRMGFVGNYLHCQSFYERFQAVNNALAMGGHPLEERFILREETPIDIYRALEKLDDLPELFICANDLYAYDTFQSLKKLGKSVPGDLMLSGFDDAPESRTVVPALTTVHIHTQIIAYSAAQLLTSRIQEPSLFFRRVYTETELICRESTQYLPMGELRE